MTEGSRAKNEYAIGGAKASAAEAKARVEAARVEAVAASRDRTQRLVGSIHRPKQKAPRLHRATSLEDKAAARAVRARRRNEAEQAIEGSRLAAAHRRRERIAEQEARALDAGARKVLAAINKAARDRASPRPILVRRIRDASPLPAFRAHIPLVGGRDGQRKAGRERPTVDIDGFANLTLKIWSFGEKDGKASDRRCFAKKALYVVDPIGLDGNSAEAVVTNMVGRGADGREPSPGSPDHDRELVRVCDAISDFECDVARTVQGEPTSQHYSHLMVAFPAGLSRRQRRRIMINLTHRFEEAGVPYVGALHRPSHDGDQRNHHLHVLVSLRGCELAGPENLWLAPTKNLSLLDPTGLRILRADAVHEFNRALSEIGSDVRFSAQTRHERGLDDHAPNSAGLKVQRKAAIAEGRTRVAALDALEQTRLSLLNAAKRFAQLSLQLQEIAHRRQLTVDRRLHTAVQMLHGIRVSALAAVGSAGRALSELQNRFAMVDAPSLVRAEGQVRARLTQINEIGVQVCDLRPAKIVDMHVAALRLSLSTLQGQAYRIQQAGRALKAAREERDIQAYLARARLLEEMSACMIAARVAKAQLRRLRAGPAVNIRGVVADRMNDLRGHVLRLENLRLTPGLAESRKAVAVRIEDMRQDLQTLVVAGRRLSETNSGLDRVMAIARDRLGSALAELKKLQPSDAFETALGAHTALLSNQCAQLVSMQERVKKAARLTVQAAGQRRQIGILSDTPAVISPSALAGTSSQPQQGSLLPIAAHAPVADSSAWGRVRTFVARVSGTADVPATRPLVQQTSPVAGRAVPLATPSASPGAIAITLAKDYPDLNLVASAGIARALSERRLQFARSAGKQLWAADLEACRHLWALSLSPEGRRYLAELPDTTGDQVDRTRVILAGTLESGGLGYETREAKIVLPAFFSRWSTIDHTDRELVQSLVEALAVRDPQVKLRSSPDGRVKCFVTNEQPSTLAHKVKAIEGGPDLLFGFSKVSVFGDPDPVPGWRTDLGPLVPARAASEVAQYLLPPTRTPPPAKMPAIPVETMPVEAMRIQNVMPSKAEAPHWSVRRGRLATNPAIAAALASRNRKR